MQSSPAWNRQRRLVIWTVMVAGLLGIGAPALVKQTNVILLAGFPLGFYLASQGVLVALAILLLVYVRLANRLERGTSAATGAHD